MSACTDEWKVVRRKKGAAGRPQAALVLPSASAQQEQLEQLDVRRTERRITDTVAELRREDFVQLWTDHVLAAAASLPSLPSLAPEQRARTSAPPLECVCFGLGPFSTCVAARHQLAMLLLLLEACQVELKDCFMYDPVFSPAEGDVLRALGLTLLTENQEGKHPVVRPTLFFLMHCGKALYNNLLWRNWSVGHLSSMIIIGNSFSGMMDRSIEREFKHNYPYISAAVAWCDEQPLPCSSRLSDVFGDTSLITFPPRSLNPLPQSTWAEPREPQYPACLDLEIILRDTHG